MRKVLFRQIFSWLSIASLLLQAIAPFSALVPQAYAQEAIPTVDQSTTTPTDTLVPTDTSSPTPSIDPSSPTSTDTIAPTDNPTDTNSPTVSPTDTVTPTDTITPLPTDTGTPTDTPTDTLTPTSDNNNNSSQGPPSAAVNPTDSTTPTPSITPTGTPNDQQSNGTLDATILKNVSAPSLDLSTTTNSGSATVSTDKTDYSPTDTAIISGSNFNPNYTYLLTVSSSNNPPTSTTVNVTTDNKGNFVYAYQLDGNYRPNYSVAVTDQGTTIATTSFTDSASNLSLDQYANAGGSPGWQHGDLNSNNSLYREGDSVPFRLTMTGASGTNSVTVAWQTTNSPSMHAYDYLTTWNRTTNPDPCAGGACSGSPTTFPIPADTSTLQNGCGFTGSQIAGNFTIWGGTITSVGSYGLNTCAPTNANTDNTITITFAATSSNVVIAWGGHIASQLDWGIGHSASSIQGSPYHMLLNSCSFSCGSQDRALQANGVLPTPGLSTQVSSSAIVLGQSVTDKASYTEANKNPVTGSTQFYVCGPTGSATACTSTSTPVGSAVTNSNDAATSSTFTPQAIGTYCFAAYYTPDASAQYSAIFSTVTTNECVTVTNPPTGTLTVTKVTNPNDTNTSFSITASGSGTITGNPTQSIKTGSPVSYTVTAGTYSVAETPLTGWTQTGNTCTNVTVAAGGNGSCIITNTKLPTLKVIKSVTNNNGGNTSASAFTIHVKSGSSDVAGSPAAGSSTGTTYTLTPGTYTVSENDPTSLGYVQIGITGDCASNGSITLAAGDNKVCTITNDDIAPSLTLVKQVVGGTDSATAWTLTATGSSQSPTNLNGTTPVVSGSNFKADTYTLAENNGPTGYTASNWSCTNGVTVTSSKITLGLNQATTCTITNTRDQGTIELKKIWSGTAGQTTLAIGTSAGGSQVISTQTGANGTPPLTTGPQTVNTGTYYVSETAGLTSYTSALACIDNGNSVTIGANNSVNVNKGDTVVCTFTNTRQTGTITVKKILNPSYDQGTFNLQVDGTTKATGGNGATTGQVTVDTGTHAVAETSANSTNMANYTSSYSCVDAQTQASIASGSGTSTSSVAVNANQNVICTFTNTRNTADLKVKKIVDDESSLSNWVFSLDGALAISADPTTGIVDFGQVTTNVNHTITEGGANQSDYTLVSVTGTNCTNNNDGKSATANIPNGTSGIICTFTNDRNTGTIQVKKIVSPSDNGATSWNFAINGQGPDNTTNNSVQGLQDGQSSQVFTSYTGNYTITESGANLNNYTTTTSCTDGTNTETNTGATTSLFTLLTGKHVVCTFTNTIIPGSIKVIKYNDLNANGTQDNGEPGLATWTMNVSSNGAQVTDNTGTATFSNVLPGTYTLSETMQNGWLQSNIACGQEIGIDNDNNHPVTVSPNTITTCYVGNYQNAHVIVTKDVLDPNGNSVTDTSTSFGFTLGAQTTTLTDGASHDFTVSPGTFSVTETPNSNYNFGSCTSSDDPYNGALSTTDGYSSTVTSGETIHVTCTNLQKKANITVHKVVVLSDGKTITNDNHTFTAQLNASNDATFSQNTPTQYVVNPGGPYSVSELSDSNYTNLGCVIFGTNTTANNMSLASNQSVSVTCTNEQNPGTISGYKFKADGTTGILGWTVNLYSCVSLGTNCNTFVASTLTDATGFYSFTNLITGFYQVVENLVSTYTPVSVTSHNVTINPGTVSTANNFANFKNINLTVCKVQDADGNLATTNDQTKVFGWSMTLLVDGIATGSSQNTNESTGCTTFSNLGPGHDYSVQEENRSGWTPLSDPNFVHDFGTPQDGVNQTYTFVNFHNVSISGFKFNDINGNGTWDQQTEPGLQNWIIDLEDTNGTILATTTTAADGSYSFSNLTPGTYRVREEGQTGWVQITTNPADISANSGQNVTNVNFGNQAQGTITVHKLVDTTGTGDFSGDDTTANQLGFTWSLDGSGTNAFGATVNGVSVTNTHAINEDLNNQPYHFVGWYPTDSVDLSCENPEGSTLPIDFSLVNPGETRSITLCNARNTGTIQVEKVVEDPNGTVVTNDPTEFTFNVASGQTTVDTTQLTGGQSNSFVVPTGTYSVTEQLPNTGYDFVGCKAHYEDEEIGNQIINGEIVSVANNETVVVVCTNQQQLPVLTITKTNNQLGNSLNPGANVIYTLTITATQSAADNVVLTDLLPKGFHYVDGSATIDTGNGSGPHTFTDFADDYHSPGIWDLGHMDNGQTFTLSLTATIDGSQNPGLYKDVAYANGDSLSGTAVSANSAPTSNAIDDGVVDQNFVGTQVNVVTPPPGANFVVAQNTVTQQVLGASTSILPETGSNTLWVILASLFLTTGLASISIGFLLRKRYV